MTNELPKPSQAEIDRHIESRALSDAELLRTGAKIVNGVLYPTELQREKAYDMHLTPAEEEKRQAEFQQGLEDILPTLALWRGGKLKKHPQWEQQAQLNPRHYGDNESGKQKSVGAELWVVGFESRELLKNYSTSHSADALPEPAFELHVHVSDASGGEDKIIAFDENASTVYELSTYGGRPPVGVEKVLRSSDTEDGPAYREALRPVFAIAEQLGKYLPNLSAQAQEAA